MRSIGNLPKHYFKYMGQSKHRIRGHTVIVDDDAKAGIRHLRRDLDYKEAETFFSRARTNRRSYFEDDHDRDFTLSRNRDGTYNLSRR